MNVGVANRSAGHALMGVTVLVYFSRPWSCAFALSQFTPEDAVPYSHFDYHGMGAMFGWLATLTFAVPVLWLASQLFVRRATTFGLFGRGPDTKTTVVSILIALAIGAPMYAQLAYLIGLPIGVSAPVAVSSLAWLLMVEVGRTAAMQSGLQGGSVVRVATAVALLAAIPKLAFLGYLAMNP